MATELGVKNQALAHIGERKLASVSENCEARRVIDDFYAGAIGHCLEQGDWNFATRNAALTSGGENTAGYRYWFVKPSDWRRTVMVSQDAQFAVSLRHFADEGGKLHADTTTLYLKYVSGDASFGGNLTLWPELFADYVAAHLAEKICLRLNKGEETLDRVAGIAKKARASARAKDAMNQPPAQPPQGNWSRSRTSFQRSQRD